VNMQSRPEYSVSLT